MAFGAGMLVHAHRLHKYETSACPPEKPYSNLPENVLYSGTLILATILFGGWNGVFAVFASFLIGFVLNGIECYRIEPEFRAQIQELIQRCNWKRS